MSSTSLAFWLIVGPLALWLLGGFVARLGGLLLILAATASLALYPNAGAVLLIGIGALMWLAGHWHFALRHHEYKSPLARYVFCRWGPAWLDPTRSWALAVETERGGRERYDADLTARRSRATTCHPDCDGGSL